MGSYSYKPHFPSQEYVSINYSISDISSHLVCNYVLVHIYVYILMDLFVSV